ncbi:hypothetical protein MTBBW1_2510017 [Desulfamplus magnetovallimortis]|uniref:Uncharacterized protein n=1 Tax=Desulfamplus magnetovallimortis TaxID=1246637 RepID=A0A1W1HEH8_9BACT|nr:hypothetical protein [Desulfamplus magnetovallimortis]SLM30899.1 hypothetical protein MTBBW1_2510017 [Desulfamplus magnetovallimortis]
MNANQPLLVTTFLANTPEEADCLLSSDYGQPLYLRILETMSKCHGMEKVVISNISQCESMAQKYHFRHLRPIGNLSVQPLATLHSCITASKFNNIFSYKNPIIILDCRFPFISTQTIANALKEYRKRDCELLISVSTANDNPIQIHQGNKLIEMGLISFIDNPQKPPKWLTNFNMQYQKNDKNYKTTLPLPIQWKNLSIYGELKPGHIAALCQMSFNPNSTYRFLTIEYLKYFYVSKSSILGYYRRENESLGRCLINSDLLIQHPYFRTVGIPPFTNLNFIHTVCIKNKKDDSSLYLTFPKLDLPIDATVRIWPYKNGKIKNKKTIEIPLANKKNLFAANNDAKQIFGTLIKLPSIISRQIDGFSYAIFSPNNTEPDFMEPVAFANYPYSYDGTSRQYINQSGESIRGRQNFEKIFTSNSSIMIMKKNKILEVAVTSINNSVVSPFQIPENESFIVESLFDLAQL